MRESVSRHGLRSFSPPNVVRYADDHDALRPGAKPYHQLLGTWVVCALGLGGVPLV